MSLEDELLEELKALRAGTGLTEARLREQETLRIHLGGDTVIDSLKKLVELVESISDTEQRVAVKHVLALVGSSSRQTTQRRADVKRALRISDSTLIRREISGLVDLAKVIIEHSPRLTTQERKDEIERVPSLAERLADIEYVLATVVKRAEIEFDGKYEPVDPEAERMNSSERAEFEEFARRSDAVVTRSGVHHALLSPLLDILTKTKAEVERINRETEAVEEEIRRVIQERLPPPEAL